MASIIFFVLPPYYVILKASVLLKILLLLSSDPPANIAYYLLLLLVSVIAVDTRLGRAFDNTPVILLFITPLVIQNISITLKLESVPIYPPANTAYYFLLSLVSVIVVAAKLYRAFDSVPVILLLISPLVIQNASITLEEVPLSLSHPPANTAYYIPVSTSVIVVAAKLYRFFDSVLVILSLIEPLVIQNASILSELTLVLNYPPANTAYYFLLLAVSVIVVAAKLYRASDSVLVVLSLIEPLVIQNASITLDALSSHPPANIAYYFLLSSVSVIVVAAK